MTVENSVSQQAGLPPDAPVQEAPEAPEVPRRWRLWPLAALIAGVICLALGSALLLLNSPSDQLPVVPEKTLDRPVDPQDDSTHVLLAGLRADQDQLSARQQDLEAKLGALLEQHRQAVASVEALRQGLESVQTRLDTLAASQPPPQVSPDKPSEDLTSLRSEITRLKTEVQALKAQVASAPTKAAVPSPSIPQTARPDPVKPPAFQVVAIERWGEDWQVTVEHGARVVLLGLGESLAGWTVAAVDPVAQTVTLESAAGRVYTARVME